MCLLWAAKNKRFTRYCLQSLLVYTNNTRCGLVSTRNTFCGTWYLPNSQIHNKRTVLIMVVCTALLNLMSCRRVPRPRFHQRRENFGVSRRPTLKAAIGLHNICMDFQNLLDKNGVSGGKIDAGRSLTQFWKLGVKMATLWKRAGKCVKFPSPLCQFWKCESYCSLTLTESQHYNLLLPRVAMHSQMPHFLVFTALHGMQTRSCDENNLSVRLSVRPSFRQTRKLWQNGRKICSDFYTIRKTIYSSFPRKRMVGGDDPIYLKV